VPIIWFNPEVPSNLSIYLVNKNTKETLVYNGSAWVSSSADRVGVEMRNFAYKLTEFLGSKRVMNLDKYANILGNLQLNLSDVEVVKLELEQIYECLINGRELTKPLTVRPIVVAAVGVDTPS
jgi:hypothetical protein